MLALGVDIGTSSLKLGAVDVTRGEFVGWAGCEYALEHPHPGWSQLDAEHYWRAFVESLDRLKTQTDLRAVKAICVSSQGQTFVPVDRSGRPLQKAWTWIDNRAAAEAEELCRRFPTEAFFTVAGVEGATPGSLCAMIRHLVRHDPPLWSQTRRFLITSSYLVRRLCGRDVMDENLAAMSGMYDWHHRRWWPEMLAAIGIDADHLPAVVPSGTAVETIAPTVADELGLSRDTVLVIGANDQTANALGAGLVDENETLIVLGTALVVFRVLGSAQQPRTRGIWSPYPTPGRSYQMGYTNSGCGTLDWAKRMFAPEVDYPRLFSQAGQVPVGCEGVTCLIDLDGRAGSRYSDYRGMFAGLSRKTDRWALIRAVLEAVACSVRELAQDLGWDLRTGPIHTVGGGARSEVWMQILADVLDCPVRRLACEQSGVLGGALMAAVGAGLIGDYSQAVARMVKLAEGFNPNEAHRSDYEQLYRRFTRLRASGDLFHSE